MAAAMASRAVDGADSSPATRTIFVRGRRAGYPRSHPETATVATVVDYWGDIYGSQDNPDADAASRQLDRGLLWDGGSAGVLVLRQLVRASRQQPGSGRD